MTVLDVFATTRVCHRDHTAPYTVEHDADGWPILVHACGCREAYEAGTPCRPRAEWDSVDPCDLPHDPEWSPDRPWLTDQTTAIYARTGSHHVDTTRVSTTHR